uniref:Putative conserved secreted protein n=1 Tax=Amblyomma parvum TaxID=251391 RepID=A0A023G294_AMBPA
MVQLPNELLLHILAFLDGASLVRCKRVCKQWLTVVTAILMHGKAVWRMICLSEINPEVLSELQGQRGLEHDRDGLDWFKTYKSWYCAGVISKSPHRTYKYSTSFKGDVTCLKASGDVIVTGHKSGLVVIWNARNGDALSEVKRSSVSITDLVLLDLHGSGTRPWDPLGCVHSHVVCAPCTPLLEAYSLGISCQRVALLRTSYPVTSLKVSGDLLATLCVVRCLVSVLRVSRNEKGLLHFQPVFRIPNKQGACSWIGISQACVTHVGPELIGGGVSLADQQSWMWRVALQGCEERLHVMHALVQRQGFVVISTVDMRVCISMDESHDLCEMEAARGWNSRATVLALWGKLLVIGLDSGRLCVYHLWDSLDDLASRQPDWAEQLGTDPITAIDVTSDPRTSRPTLVAATRHKLHVITWPIDHTPDWD